MSSVAETLKLEGAEISAPAKKLGDGQLKEAGGAAAEGWKVVASYAGFTGGDTMYPLGSSLAHPLWEPLTVKVGDGELMEAGGDAAAPWKAAKYLGATGVATMSSALAGAVVMPPAVLAGGVEAYSLALLGFFLAGVAEVGACVWASQGPAGRRAVAKAMLPPALLLLAAVAGLTAVAFY